MNNSESEDILKEIDKIKTLLAKLDQQIETASLAAPSKRRTLREKNSNLETR